MITFYTGPMSAGKSTLLLQDRYNLMKQGLKVLTATASDKPVIKSRFSGHEELVYGVDAIGGVRDFVVVESDGRLDYILIDEAQFMEPEKIEKLVHLADVDMVNIRAYGLTSDFKGDMFPGTAKWIALSDDVQWLQGSVPCWCGRPARMNSRVVQGQVTHKGDQVMEGDIKDDTDMYYVPLCRRHWHDKKLGL